MSLRLTKWSIFQGDTILKSGLVISADSKKPREDIFFLNKTCCTIDSNSIMCSLPWLCNIYLPQLLRLYLKKCSAVHYCWLISHTLLWSALSRQANFRSLETEELPFTYRKTTPGPLCSIKYFNRDIEQPFAFLSWRDWYWRSSLYKVSFKIDYRMCEINLSIVAFSNVKKEVFFLNVCNYSKCFSLSLLQARNVFLTVHLPKQESKWI